MTGSKAKQNSWLILIITILAAAAAAGTLFKVPPIMGDLMESLSLSASQGGWLFSVFAVVGIFVSIPMGIIITRFGLRKSGLIALLSVVVGSLIGVFSTSITPLLASRIIEGIGMTLLATVGPAVVSSSFGPEKRGVAMGFFMTYMSIGQIAMFNLAPRIVVPYGWQGVWWFTAIFAAVIALLWLIFIKGMDGNEESDAAGTEINAAKSAPSLGMVLKSKNIWLITIMFVTFMISFEGVLVFIPSYLVQDRGLAATTASSLASVLGLVGIIGAIAGGMISDKLGSRKWPIIICMLADAALFALVPSFATAMFIVLIILMGFFANALPTVAFSAITEVMSNPAAAGLSVAVLCAGQYLGLFLSSAIFGYIVDASGWATAFYAMAVISAIGAIIMPAAKDLK